MSKLLLMTAVAIALLLSACGADDEARAIPTPVARLDTATPGPAETATPAEETAPPQMPMESASPLAASTEAGHALYQSAGCAACHGEEGGGGVGPALAGHTQEQIFRQVRTPKGNIMPAFPTDRLSDAEMTQITAWIGSLGDEMAMEHDEGEEFDLTMTEAAHLRLIIDAITAENAQNAIHHAQHLVDDAAPEILPLAQNLLVDLQGGEAHNVEMEAAEILGPLADEEFDQISVHLGMTLTALQRQNLTDAEHHINSAVEAAVGHDHEAELQRIQADLRTGGDLHAVTDQLYELLGQIHPQNEP